MTETRTLCLTDVVDSTKLATELGDARNGALWDAHDALARALVAQWRGTELERTDGIMVLFDIPADALGFAVAYHAAVRTLDPPLVARAGIHTGPLAIRPNPADHVARGAKRLEVDGLAIAVTARVMSVAVGGQTLITFIPETTHRVVSHGHWHLKGVPEPVELFEVGDETAPFVPPPDAGKVYRVVRTDDFWLPVREVKHSLPRQRDAFVGRTADLDDLAARFDGGAALVSVLGMGGTGKTRFAIQYGWTWLGEWPGGVWFCDVSEARSVDGIVYAVARALDVPLGKGDPVVQLGHAIAGRGRCLVLLDNFEQVARHARETLGRWLDRAKDAAFVVTTREVLGLAGEQALALAPLPVADGVALFVARAQAAKRDFALLDAERPAVDALVKLLDGLPLAIELAAARVRLMPPNVLLQRMSERFKLLASSAGRHTRQATLRAALDWSWDLLSADEQAALAQVSVFEGGFTLEAAEAVFSLAELWPMDAVQALVDKSLVRRVSDDRFDLLLSVQEYAAERLSPEAGSAAEDRHGGYFATFGTDEAIDALDLHGGVDRRRALSRELDNVLSATRRAVSSGSAEVALATLRAAWAVIKLQGPTGVAVELAAAVRGVPGLPQRGEAARLHGAALQWAGRGTEARAAYEEALAVSRQVRDRRLEGAVLGNLGNLHQQHGRIDEARAHHHAALAIHREVDPDRGVDRHAEGIALGNLAILKAHEGGLEEACAQFAAVLGIHREVGDRRSEGVVLANLANLYSEHGRMDEARAHHDAALAVLREVGNRRDEGIVLCNLGNFFLEQGRMDEARAQYAAALAVDREVGNRRDEAVVLTNLGILHHEQGRMDEGSAYYQAALAVHREVGNRRFEGAVLGHLGVLHLDRGEALVRTGAAGACRTATGGRPRRARRGLRACGRRGCGEGRRARSRAREDPRCPGRHLIRWVPTPRGWGR